MNVLLLLRGGGSGLCAVLMCITQALATTPGCRPVPSCCATAVQLLVPYCWTNSLCVCVWGGGDRGGAGGHLVGVLMRK